MQSLSRSIIFGNEFKNGYGTFLSLCSAISSLDQVTKIIAYLRENPKFKKYNRFVYAYRVEQLPAAFVTEHKDLKPMLYQGIHEDRTVQGAGQKLLYLLQKFNIRNVLTVVVIEQADVLRRFGHENYRVVVERAKELLNSLYQKMVAFENPVELGAVTSAAQPVKTVLKPTLANQVMNFPKLKSKADIKERPGHIYADGKPKFLQSQSADKQDSQVRRLRRQLRLLQGRLQKKAVGLQRLLQGLSQKQVVNLRFVIQYENNTLLSKVIKMVSILFGVEQSQLIRQTITLERLKSLSLRDMDRSKANRITGMVIADRRLNFDLLMGHSPILALIFQIVTLLAASFRTQESIDEKTTQLESLMAQTL